MILHCGTKSLDLAKPKIMGILNTTPDSFSDGGNSYRSGQLDLSLAVARAEQMMNDGASIIDVGGESTRPGAVAVGLEEELARVIPVVKAITSQLDVIVSVDSSSPEVISAAAAAGAGLINDVRALQKPGALEAAAATKLPVCIMHMQGQPDTMQDSPEYEDIVEEVNHFFRRRVDDCVKAGITLSNLILDPGFGFGKTLEHNVAMVRQLRDFQLDGLPVLAGMSRKSMLQGLLQRSVDQRLAGSLGLAMLAVQNGASILRVHDVAQTRDIVELYWQLVAVKNVDHG